jgi:threonine/homoserine/homoserine lactone efflux protein
MKNENKITINTKKPKIVLILSIITSVFWYIGQSFNVYNFAVVGAVFEILWLPMIALVIILPISSLFYLVK